MVFLEMFLQCVVVNIVLLLAVSGSSITDMAPLVLVPTVGVQLVVSVEPLSAETTLRMTFKTALVDRPRGIVSVFFVLAQFRHGKQRMLVREHLFVSSTQITTTYQPAIPFSTNPGLDDIPHRPAMLTLDMPVQVRPSQASHIARPIRTIVPQQQDRILKDLVLLVLNA